MKQVLIFSITIFFFACSTDSGTYKKSKDITNMLITSVPSPWSEINAEGSDYALSNEKTQSIFLFNSACRKYEASNLNALTSAMLSGIEELVIIERKNTFYQGRDAVEVLASGKLDGVLRFFRIVTIQKNNCIYDYVLIATTQKNIDADTPLMKTFLQRIILK